MMLSNIKFHIIHGVTLVALLMAFVVTEDMFVTGIAAGFAIGYMYDWAFALQSNEEEREEESPSPIDEHPTITSTITSKQIHADKSNDDDSDSSTDRSHKSVSMRYDKK
jgi:hypothetical protein